MVLLLPSSPVSVIKDPLPCPGQELPTTLRARDTNQSKSPRSIDPTDVFETQKLEGFRPSQSVPQTCHGCEPPQRGCAESFPRPAPDRIPRTASALSAGSDPHPVGIGNSPRNRQQNATDTPRP